MPVDNTLYQRPGDIWWDDREPLSLLRTALDPARFGYFRHTLVELLRINPRGAAALDVGCGGGSLAEEFSRLGCQVTGVDPAEAALAVARAHAAASGLAITYRAGTGEALPCADETFDIVYCCDTLEHVINPDQVIAEVARALKPGGVFFYDTINRSWLSKLLAIKLAQEWRATRVLPPNLHDWNQFIKPAELDALLIRHGLKRQDGVGLLPGANPMSVCIAIWRYKRGAISVGELGRRLAFRASGSLSVSYAGYALKVA